MRTHALTIFSLLVTAGSMPEPARAAPARGAASAAAREACVSQLSVIFANGREAQGLAPYTSSAQIDEFEQRCAANPAIVSVSDRNSDAERCISRHWTWLRDKQEGPDTGTPLMSAAQQAAVNANCKALARPIPAAGLAIANVARHHGNLTTALLQKS